MSNRITFGKSTQTGADVAQFINTVQLALNQGRRLKGKLDSMAFGNPADYAAVASELRLPEPAEGETQAQDAWSILETAIAQLDSGPIHELARLDI